MRKFLLTLTTLCFALFTQAQDVNTMYINYKSGETVEVKVADVESITFATSETETPDNPNTSDKPALTAGEAIDLGLSVKWASWNVGATAPEEYGGYYAWGETEEKDDYDWDTYKWCNGSDDTMTKYCTNSDYGTVDNRTTLEPSDDVAHVKWGGPWRMPTDMEVEELAQNCTWEWTVLNGINGYKVTGPNGNSIFLPAAGDGDGTKIYDQGEKGSYWSNTLYISGVKVNEAWGIRSDEEDYNIEGIGRSSGRTVRPVCD